MIRLVVVFVLASLTPGFTAAQSLKEIRVGSSNISVTNVVAYYARDRKFFEAEGFDVKIIIIKTEATLPALVAGDLDYSTLSTSAIEAALNGLPLRVIAITNKYPLLGVVVRKGINNVADLRGKKLSVSSNRGAETRSSGRGAVELSGGYQSGGGRTAYSLGCRQRLSAPMGRYQRYSDEDSTQPRRY
jgi:ABC-type nitrate/sulfonate/bicarbonate transport system substrate-binding protein